MSPRQKGFTLIELIVVLIILPIGILSGVGWIWNIIKLVGMNFEPVTTLLVLRIVGIPVAPLGMIVGYM